MPSNTKNDQTHFFKEHNTQTTNASAVKKPFDIAKEKLGEEKFKEYKAESDYLYDKEYQEMADSSYGLPNGRGGVDVFRPLRFKYHAAHVVLMANYGLLSPKHAEENIHVFSEYYFKLTNEALILTDIIEKKYPIPPE